MNPTSTFLQVNGRDLRSQRMHPSNPLKVDELAARAGVSESTIRRLEATGGGVRIDTARKLAAALRCKVRDLITDVEVSA